MKKLNLVYLVLAILFAVAGGIQCVRWSLRTSPNPAHLINFLPAIAFLCAYVA